MQNSMSLQGGTRLSITINLIIPERNLDRERPYISGSKGNISPDHRSYKKWGHKRLDGPLLQHVHICRARSEADAHAPCGTIHLSRETT